MGEVEIDAFLPQGIILSGRFEDTDKAQQGSQPDFMIRRGYTFLQTGERNICPALFHNSPRYGHLDAKEEVTLSILPLPGLEKARQTFHLKRVGLLHHSGFQYIS